MQIREIVLYGNNGQTRHLKFHLGKMNIITGESKSGKSAVGDIIDYCLGSSNCNIADGVVRDSVSWFGLLLQFPTERVFVARENPGVGNQTTSSCYYEIGENIEVPENGIVASNTNTAGIIEIINRRIGINENIHIPPEGQTRNPLSANIRHALNLCFQGQDEIAAKNILFHRQSEPFILQSIKDTLPFFLGAVREDALLLADEMRSKKRELKLLKQQKMEAELLSGGNSVRAISLLNEASAVGLISQVDELVQGNGFRKILETLANIKIEDSFVEHTEHSKLVMLQDQLDKEYESIEQIDEEIRSAVQYVSEFSGYGDEMTHQKVRLESIGLFENIDFTPGKCPFCSNDLQTPLPEIDFLKKSILDLGESLENITKELPKLRSYIDGLRSQRATISEKISQLKNEIESIYQLEEDARKVRDLNTRKAKVIGRISLWLESTNEPTEDSSLDDSIKTLQDRINEIQEALDVEAVNDRMSSLMSKMQTDMTAWAKHLSLEHSNHPYRYDANKATVVVDKDRPVMLNQLGSGSNWVGVHLITYMAFHKQFILNNRPVPRFLFLDQPSQVYFPTSPDDIDMKAVSTIYRFINDQVNEHQGKMQVIVVDHANLEEPYFKQNVIEIWRDNQKLVPVEWYSDAQEV